MHKKAISKRKWKAFVKKLVGFIFLCVLGCGIAGLLWFPHFFPKRLVVSPIGQKGFNLSKNEVIVTNVEHLCQSYNLSCDNVSVASDSSVMIVIANNGLAILDPNKSLDKQVASLQLAIANLTIEGKRFKTFDFRFDRPVITF